MGATASSPEERPLILVFDRANRLLPRLRAHAGTGFRFEAWRVGDPAEALAALVAEADAIVTGPGFQFSMLASSSRLKLLQLVTAGYDWVDFAEVPQGVYVCRTSSMDAPIAEYVIAAILEWQLGIARYDRAFREKRAFVPPFGAPGQKTPSPFHAEAGGKTLGIVGLGQLGTQIARRAAALDMRVIATAGRPRSVEELPAGVAWLGAGNGEDLERLLRESDFVVLCCALSEETRGLLDARRLAMLGPRAVVINVGRGPLCDEDSLYAALRDRSIGGAVLDVWWNYPSADAPPPWPSKHPFHELDNVVMTPHSSGWSAEQEERKVEQIASNLAAVAAGQPPSFILRHSP